MVNEILLEYWRDRGKEIVRKFTDIFTDLQKMNITWTFEILIIKAEYFIKIPIINFHLLEIYYVSSMNQACSIIYSLEMP